jgi:uncharacterized protein with FMN-binding domain
MHDGKHIENANAVFQEFQILLRISAFRLSGHFRVIQKLETRSFARHKVQIVIYLCITILYVYR